MRVNSSAARQTLRIKLCDQQSAYQRFRHPILTVRDSLDLHLDIPLYESIRAALTLGGEELAVDAVLLIGEHGDYPRSELGQEMLPQRYFFEQIACPKHRLSPFCAILVAVRCYDPTTVETRMLIRQRTILGLLARIGRPVMRTTLVKLVFLLRHETALRHARNFYDFVPYRYGPFSFTLFRDLELLTQAGHISFGDTVSRTPETADSGHPGVETLSNSITSAVAHIASRYGDMAQSALIETVYHRHAWYALNSELSQRDLVSPQRPDDAVLAVYTAGYEGRSIEAFIDDLLSRGIGVVIDVRANPVSRKYGFSKSRLARICARLGLTYHHLPALGIPSSERAKARSHVSREHLLRRYARSILPLRSADVKELGTLMTCKPSVLMCVEARPQDCHRGKLAQAVADVTGLDVVNI